jgi:hypothetical protein
MVRAVDGSRHLVADLSLKPAKGVVSPIDVLMLKPSPEIEPFIGMHTRP